MRDLTQKEYDKLIAISSSMLRELRYVNAKKVMIDICQGEDEGKIEMMTLEEIDEFLDGVFEYDVE